MAKEQRWLPTLAPHLPLAIPAPLGLGEPAEGYPYRWSVYRWLHGENPVVGQLPDPAALATELAEFITALQRVDATGGPRASRGAPLKERDEPTRAAIAALAADIDTDAATAAWQRARRAPSWSGPPVWVHGDIAPGNLLYAGDRLTAVIDFGAMGTGDPACDLIVAWNLLPAEVRPGFRAALGVDDATWERGRGWALSIALVALAYYRGRNPPLAANSRHVIAEVLAD